MKSIAQNNYINTRALTTLLIIVEALLLVIMMKSVELSVLFFLLLSLTIYIYHKPEFGLAIALTGRILLGLLFDNLMTALPYPILTSYLIIIAIGALLYLLNRPLPQFRIYAPQWWAGIILIILIFGLSHSTNLSYGKQKIIFYFVLSYLLVILPLLVINSEKEVKNILYATYFLGMALGVISTFLALATPDYLRFQPSENVNPIWFSRSLGVSLVSSLLLIMLVKRRALKLLIIVTWPIFIYPMLRSWSRGPLLGVILAMVAFFYLQPKISWRLKVLGSALVLIAGIGVLTVTSSVILARLQAPIEQEASAAFRLLAWVKAAQLFVSHPITGIGTGSFFIDFPFTPFIYPHNVLLEIACENGIIGLGALGMFLLTSFLMGWKNIYRAEDRTQRQVNIVLMAIFIYALWNAQMSGDIAGNEVIWLTAGMMSALVQHRQEKQTKAINKSTTQLN